MIVSPNAHGVPLDSAFHHIPVLLAPVLDVLSPRPGERYLDVTLGGAGHAQAIARKLAHGGTVIGVDRDPSALGIATQRLQTLCHAIAPLDGVAAFELHTFLTSFIHFDTVLRENGIPDRHQGGGFDAVLADFGLSSPQIDDASRGFSFQTDAPLDMRMSQEGPTAAEFIKSLSADALADILYENGDIRQSRRLAKRICERAQDGTLETTKQLADVCCDILGRPRPGQPHPATRPFQAIRIALNQEFEAIDAFLENIPQWIRPGGRLAVISFHSGEDRRVKMAFKRWQNPCTCPPGLPVCVCHKTPLGRCILKKPVEASPEELKANSRARSAKLRAFLFD